MRITGRIFEDALYAADGYNEKGKYYTEYMDITSFADQWLFYELNTEISMSSSIYYYKQSEVDGDGLLHACYPWDMEHALRSTNHVTSGGSGVRISAEAPSMRYGLCFMSMRTLRGKWRRNGKQSSCRH